MKNIFETLGFLGLDFGNIQSVDSMTVVPILGDDRTKNAADPKNVKFTQTSNYGTMIFENEDENGFGIVPTNTMVISERAAQDHAMSEVGIVGANESKSYQNACCVQQSQGGLLSGEKNEYNILPLELRKVLLDPTKRAKRGYDKIWRNIETFLKDIPGIQHGQGHLEYFFRPFKKELDDFAAEFEPVENQLGAAIFFNKFLVGLELMPTVAYWSTLWKWVIRGCYGAQLIKMQKAGQLKGMRLELPTIETDVVGTIEQFVNSAKNDFVATFANIQSILSTEKKTGVPLITQRLAKIGTGGGDIVYEETNPIYLSSVI